MNASKTVAPRLQASFQRILSLARSVSRSRWLFPALVPALLLLWLYEHDARVRQAAELRRFTQQAATEAAALEGRAQDALAEANQRNARAIAELESRRAQLERAAKELQARLSAAEQSERAAVERLATLPAPELTRQLAQQLGSDALRPADAGRSAALTDQGLRQVATALVELDACREQRDLLRREVSTCAERAEADSGIIATQAASIAKLNEAAAAQAQLLALREAESRAELEAARGTRRGRFARALEHMAIGFVLGVVIR